MHRTVPAYCPLSRGDLAVKSKPAKNPNQDAYAEYKGTHCSALAIADGLGSSCDADIAAGLVVEQFVTGVRSLDNQSKAIDIGEVRQLWDTVADPIQLHYQNNLARYQEQPKALQTTLATVIDLEESYLISYLGNGSILHIRGDFWSFGERRWPWCVTDLMLGHSCLTPEGKDALYGIIDPQGLSAAARFLQLWKDTMYGDILVLCSDGISSPDHLRLGHDANEKLWVEVNPHIEALVTTFLKQYLAQLGQQADTGSMLTQTLETFLRQRTFDDDATIGIMVSQQARDYYTAQHLES